MNAFIERVADIGGEPLVRFAEELEINSPQELVKALDEYLRTLQQAGASAPTTKDRTFSLLGDTPGVIEQGFAIHAHEIAHVEDLLGKARREFSV